ncbi:MAG: hypothetical protein QOD99_781, partial [Chthoniobacter sp.]|nr:hypothetical protein [Chthoniobacter sp.]
ARESFLSALALTVVTLMPVFWKIVSPSFFTAAALCDSLLIICALRFLLQRDRPSARRLFFASIIYLPLLLGFLVWAKA